MNKTEKNIQSHYTLDNLTGSILSMIKKAGIDIDNLQPDDLVSFDEFHVRGRMATIELAELAGIKKDMRVLDIGSGIGGPSRFLAANIGCQVTGIDLTEEYCQLSELFAEKLKLNDKITYQCCSALDMPFEDNSFDIIWTQHVAMNIQDKEKLYAEAARVLKPKGTFAIYDILADKNQPIHFPVPWADDQSMSFLATFEQMKTYLEKNNMLILDSRDYTKDGIEWFRAMNEKVAKEGPAPLSVHLLLGDAFTTMVQTLIRNAHEERVRIVQIIAKKN